MPFTLDNLALHSHGSHDDHEGELSMRLTWMTCTLSTRPAWLVLTSLLAARLAAAPLPRTPSFLALRTMTMRSAGGPPSRCATTKDAFVPGSAHDDGVYGFVITDGIMI